MPITAPHFFRKLAFTFPAQRNLAFYELAQWLNGSHSTEVGPGWTCVAADDTTRIDSGNLSDMNSANDWSTINANTPPNGSWIALQSQPGLTDRMWILLLFFGEFGTSNASPDRVGFVLIPRPEGPNADPFVVPELSTAGEAPAVPSGSMVKEVYTDDTQWIGSIQMIANADESSLNFLPCFAAADPLNQPTWWVGGEVEDGPPNQDRNWVAHTYDGGISTGPNITTSTSNTGFSRETARNGDFAVVSLGRWATFYANSGAYRVAADPDSALDDLGEPPILPVWVSFYDSNRQQVAGRIRHVFEVNPVKGQRGTLNGRTLLFMNYNTSDPNIAITWDGATDFP